MSFDPNGYLDDIEENFRKGTFEIIFIVCSMLFLYNTLT